MKIVAAGTNPVQLTRGMDKTTKHLVAKLKEFSKEVADSELASVASVSAGGNQEIGDMIATAMSKVRYVLITIAPINLVSANTCYRVLLVEPSHHPPADRTIGPAPVELPARRAFQPDVPSLT
eukprot:3480079-Pyramimonas_sp.AAC.1